MSVRFENGAALWAGYNPMIPSEQIPALPVSVQCWVYLPDDPLPTMGTFWPIWSLGERDAQNYLALEAEPGSTAGTVKLTAAFSGGARVTKSIDNLAAGDWRLVTVVLVSVGQTGNAELRLYVDDLAAAKQVGNGGALTPADWNVFLLGQTLEQSGTVENPTFHAEHPAIWRDELQDGVPSVSDAGRMYSEKIPPWQAGTRLASGTGRPDFGYWFITAHSRSGLRVRNDQDGENSGDLFNQSNPPFGQPLLQTVETGTSPRWSARTPILRYVYDLPITPSPRPPFREPGRLQPAFFVFNDNASDGSADEIRDLPIFSDPNIFKMCAGDYLSCNDVKPKYRGAVTQSDFVPTKDLALTAKRCADYFEIQSFTVGNGIGPGRRYAGAMFIRGPGNGGIHDDRLRGYDGGDFRGITGAADTIPLEMNIADWVGPGSTHADYVLEPWQTWYRQEGVELLAEYMDHFWRALKQELDDRGLCYPARVHMDYERWPRETQQLRLDYVNIGGLSSLTQTGTWPKMIADTDRYENQVLAYAYDSTGGEVAQTLEDLSPPAFDPDLAFYDQGDAFIDWWWNWSYVTRMQAAAESIFETLNDHFEFTRWGNYQCFVADNADYPFVEGWFGRGYNSAPDGVVRGMYSSPTLYSNDNWVDRIRGEYGRIGYTVCESVRDVSKMRIDACASSRRSLDPAPWFENPLRHLDYGVSVGATYDITIEDQRDVLEYAWKRGTNEYILFTYDPTLERLGAWCTVAQWLRDTVHATAQTRQDHAARTGRLARRSM
ncbi:MAG: hypothetical protein ACIAS6_02570 [Phycisphaerales bacterium JB060]